MAKRHLRNCSISLITREMQIKTTLRYNLTPVRMAKIENTEKSFFRTGCGVRGTLLHCWWKCNLLQPFWKSVWQFLRKLGINLPQDPAILLLGIHLKEAHSHHKDICSIMFIGTLFVEVRTCKQPRCPSTEEWRKTMWYTSTMEYYTADILKFACKWTVLENNHPEWGNPDPERQI